MFIRLFPFLAQSDCVAQKTNKGQDTARAAAIAHTTTGHTKPVCVCVQWFAEELNAWRRHIWTPESLHWEGMNPTELGCGEGASAYRFLSGKPISTDNGRRFGRRCWIAPALSHTHYPNQSENGQISGSFLWGAENCDGKVDDEEYTAHNSCHSLTHLSYLRAMFSPTFLPSVLCNQQ